MKQTETNTTLGFTNQLDLLVNPTQIPYLSLIDHFTVVCLVAWPLNESEAGVDLVLMETSLLFLHKFLLINMRTASLT